jgi:hypothetical protein
MLPDTTTLRSGRALRAKPSAVSRGGSVSTSSTCSSGDAGGAAVDVDDVDDVDVDDVDAGARLLVRRSLMLVMFFPRCPRFPSGANRSQHDDALDQPGLGSTSLLTTASETAAAHGRRTRVR